jgi:hypothetical protein
MAAADVAEMNEAPAAATEVAETEPATEETLRTTDDATGTDEDTVADEAGFRLAEQEPAGTDSNFEPITLSTTPRQQPYEIGIVGNLVGIVVFGFVGLALGYWLLNFFGGARFNFLDIPLPFVSSG